MDWKPNEKRKVSSGTLTPRYAVQKENCDPCVPKKSPGPPAVSKADEAIGPSRSPTQAPATGVAKPVPRPHAQQAPCTAEIKTIAAKPVARPPTQQAPCTAEIKTIGAFPPLMRAVSWDTVGSHNARNGAPGLPPTTEETFSFSDRPRDGPLKSSGYKDLAEEDSMAKRTQVSE